MYNKKNQVRPFLQSKHENTGAQNRLSHQHGSSQEENTSNSSELHYNPKHRATSLQPCTRSALGTHSAGAERSTMTHGSPRDHHRKTRFSRVCSCWGCRTSGFPTVQLAVTFPYFICSPVLLPQPCTWEGSYPLCLCSLTVTAFQKSRRQVWGPQLNNSSSGFNIVSLHLTQKWHERNSRNIKK